MAQSRLDKCSSYSFADLYVGCECGRFSGGRWRSHREPAIRHVLRRKPASVTTDSLWARSLPGRVSGPTPAGVVLRHSAASSGADDPMAADNWGGVVPTALVDPQCRFNFHLHVVTAVDSLPISNYGDRAILDAIAVLAEQIRHSEWETRDR